MINSLQLQNFGPISQIKCDNLGQINLVIGGNGTGKTILLKALYTALRTIEAYKRGNEPRTISEILAEKLYWTFEIEKVGDLVTKGSEQPLLFQISFNYQNFLYQLGRDTHKNIAVENQVSSPRLSNSIFLPTKEVLSLHSIILGSRERDQTFGFVTPI